MPASFSISSLLGDHLSCSALSRLFPYTSLFHHSPQLVRKMRSGSSGKSFRVRAARMLAAPALCQYISHYTRRELIGRQRVNGVSDAPSGTVLASGICMDSLKSVERPRPVLGMRPGETATTRHWPWSWRRHQCAPRSWVNLLSQ